MIFIPIEKSQQLLNLSEGLHEIAITFKDDGLSPNNLDGFWKRYSSDANEALSWKKIMPQLEAALTWSTYLMGIVVLILFAIIALGVMNTLFMSLYERMFEFGVLRAVGTRPARMASMIVCEAGVLSLISIFFGNIIGLILSHSFAVNGINYVGVEFGGITFSEPIYPVVKVS